MKINIKVKTNSKEQGVGMLPDGIYLVKVKSEPIKGKANTEIVKVLAKHFNTTQSNIKIIRGVRSINKIVEVVV